MKKTFSILFSEHVGQVVQVVFVLCFACVVGEPVLEGQYLTGDDEQLIFHHGLVTFPSWEHALRLFAIVHRDLYQPIPLLTFQLEFAVHRGQLWWMHLTNVLLHGLNGLLVWAFLRRLSCHAILPFLVSVLFVTHPLSVECYAWLNGRMFLLSSFFSLANLILFDIWYERFGKKDNPSIQAKVFSSWWIVFLVVLSALLSQMSKFSGGQWLVLFILPWVRGYRPNRRWWLMWGVIFVLTILSGVLNYRATTESKMFEGADQQLQGSNLARVILALGWYFSHYVWPAGLSPWYAPPRTVSWWDGNVGWSILICLLIGVMVVGSVRRTRVVLAGGLWFMAHIAATLPFMPARNLLAADRYAYLPNVGLHWILAYGILSLLIWIDRRGCFAGFRWCWRVGVVGLVMAWVAVSWQVGEYYHDNRSKGNRIFEVCGEYPALQVALGWECFERGEYQQAIEYANRELGSNSSDTPAFLKATNLRAMARYRLDRDVAGAEADLLAAIDRDPAFAKSYYRLGLVYYGEDDWVRAEPMLLKCIEMAPGFNPALHTLAKLYRQTGRWQEASRMYQRALDNSQGFDVDAINGLGEVEIKQGFYPQAIERYRQMLSWYQRGVTPRINLAIALNAVGEWSQAIDQLRQAVEIEPSSLEARMNLGLFLAERKEDASVWEQYQYLLRYYSSDLRVLEASTRFLRSRHQYTQAADIWKVALESKPESTDLLAWNALHQWYLQNRKLAGQYAQQAVELASGHLLANMVQLLLTLDEADPPAIEQACERFLSKSLPKDHETYQYVLEALEYKSGLDSQNPWPYYVSAVVLQAQRQTEMAWAFTAEFEKMTPDSPWSQRLKKLLSDSSELLPVTTQPAVLEP